MQKRFKLLTLSIASLLLVGCGRGSTHTHIYSGDWSYDSETHFHKCTGKDCDSKSEVASHTFDDTNTCTVCGYKTNPSSNNEECEHDWTNWEITDDPTCTLKGSRSRDCKLCGATETADIDIDPTNHSFIADTASDKAATCTEPGVSGSTICIYCGTKRAGEVVPAKGHSYGKWVTIDEPTATQDGKKKKTCEICNREVIESIPKTSEQHVHSYGEWITVDEPTTTQEGTKKRICEICNNEEYASIPKLDEQHVHSYGEWQITIAPTETEAGVKERVCSCGDKQTASVPATGPVNSSFNITTDLTATKEIHTQLQKEYLSYTGEYATMPSSSYPDGNQLLSDPLPVQLAWTFTPASGKTVKQYSVTFGQESDLSDGYEVVGTSSPSIQLYNVFLGTNYFKITATYTDNSKDSSAIKSFKVDETGPRNIYLGPSMTNVRDCGGRATTAGGKIKQGLLYRTCGNGYQTKSTKTPIDNEGKSIMLNQLKVKTEINVSDGTSYNLNLSGTTVYDAKMDYGGNAKDHFSRNAESVKNVFKILSDENNYPIFYHCRIGTDRTGLIGNLVLGLLGVPLNMIYQDYLFSNFGNIEGKRYIGSQAGEDDISKYMNEISNMPGATYQEKVYNTLLSIGIPSTTLDKVINLLTVGTKANNSQGQMANNAGNMLITGGSATHTTRSKITDRNDPEDYVTLGNNVSASYTFTTTTAGTAKIYGYLGHNDYTDSKNINSSVSVSIDDVEVSVPNKTFKAAGMGNCNGRTNYYFVPLGEKSNLSAGTHTIKITGKANSMKLGTLSIFGVAGTVPANQGGTSSGQGGGSQGGGTTTNETEVTSFLASTVTAQSGASIVTNNAGTYYKLGKTNDYLEYNFNSTVEGKAYLKAYVGTKAVNATSSNKLWFDGSNVKFTFTFNNSNVEFTDKTTTFGDVGMTTGSAGGSGDSNSPVWVEFPEITLVKGSNSFKLTRTAGYTLYFYEFKVVTR